MPQLAALFIDGQIPLRQAVIHYDMANGDYQYYVPGDMIALSTIFIIITPHDSAAQPHACLHASKHVAAKMNATCPNIVICVTAQHEIKRVSSASSSQHCISATAPMIKH